MDVISDHLVEFAVHPKGDNSMANWISSIPYESHHDFACQNLLAGSGQWLFDSDEFISWDRADPLTSTVLWLHGIPGSGKTSLVALAIQRERKRLTDTKAQLAFFYCQRSSAEPQRSKQRELLCSLLRQLAFDKNGGLKEPVRTLDEKKKKDAALAQHEVQMFTDEEVITLLVKLFKMRNTTIMIDALDEMVRDERPTLYEVFDNISERLRDSNSTDNRHAVLRLLVSSRNDRDIVLKLSSYRNVCIGVEKNREDIREFVKRELKKSIRGYQLLVDTPEDQQQAILESIERTLVAKAQGMYVSSSLTSSCGKGH
jgi:transcription termination factor NusB